VVRNHLLALPALLALGLSAAPAQTVKPPTVRELRVQKYGDTTCHA